MRETSPLLPLVRKERGTGALNPLGREGRRQKKALPTRPLVGGQSLGELEVKKGNDDCLYLKIRAKAKSTGSFVWHFPKLLKTLGFFSKLQRQMGGKRG
jgi:hypothetical protein